VANRLAQKGEGLVIMSVVRQNTAEIVGSSRSIWMLPSENTALDVQSVPLQFLRFGVVSFLM